MDFNIFFFVKLMESINTQTSMSYVAASLANSAYKPQYVTSVVWSRSQHEDVTDFLKLFHGSVVTAKIQNNNNHITRELHKAVGYKQTVLFAVSAEEFAYFITSVNLDLVVPIRLVLVLTAFVEDLSVITRTAWENDLADITIVSQNQEGNLSVTTYYPYRKGICGDYTPVALKIVDMKIFPKKFANFYRCPIKTALVNYIPYLKMVKTNQTITGITGIDGKILTNIIENLNATIDIVSTEDRDGMGSFINGTPTGCFGDLVNKIADIIAPAGIISRKRYRIAQISHVYATIDVHWCAPSRRIIYRWAKVLLPLLDFITIYMFLTLIVFVVFTAATKRCVLPKRAPRKSVFFQSFVILLGQVVKFETKSYVVNSLFVLWIWFCFVFRIAYQCDLIEGLHRVIQEPPLKSLKNALDVVEGHGGVEVFYDLYRDSPIQNNFTILRPYEVIPYIKAVSKGKRFLLLTDVLLISEFDAKVQILDKSEPKIAACLFMRPGWPAAKRVDLLIQQMMEMGLTAKIKKDHRYEWEKKHQIQKEEYVHPPLDFLTLSACFYGLIFMWITTSVIFIIEITHKNIQKKIK